MKLLISETNLAGFEVWSLSLLKNHLGLGRSHQSLCYWVPHQFPGEKKRAVVQNSNFVNLKLIESKQHFFKNNKQAV